MTSRRGTSNSNQRGFAAQRRELKIWMLEEFGDGYTAPCAFCEEELDWFTMTKDRYPVPGVEGGKYERGNVRPACGRCNSRGGQQLAMERRRRAKLQASYRSWVSRANPAVAAVRLAEALGLLPADETTKAA